MLISHHKLHLDTQKDQNKKKKISYNMIDEYEKNETIINYNLSYNIVMINNDKIDKSNNISNKEALKEKIHEIHNYLRNNGAGYGMNALKVFNIIYGLKKIKENNLLDKVNLCSECDFSYLLDLANKGNNEKLVDVFIKQVLDSIHSSPLKNFLFYEIPKNIKGYVLSHLIKEINKITLIEKTCNVQLSGKIYEYFINRDESAISELGAYFTDRHIVNYIYQNKLQPTINKDGSISNMIDMFGGSGGFTTGYINYLNKNNIINWENELSKIYHYDMNEDVIKYSALEFFCITGELPNMKYNLHYKNSMNDEFDDKKFKYIITNPPYGGDKNKVSEGQIKRDKIKNYIKKLLLESDANEIDKELQKQLNEIEAQEKTDKKENDKNKVCLASSSARIQKYAKINNLKGNDKESISLILMMDLLDIDGTCIGVLKEGVFFNKTYADLRRTLITNFNVREVISIPSDQFENTSTKTSIIIFDNTKEKTFNVKFYDLVIERYDEDKFEKIYNKIELVENKGDIKNVYDKLISKATKEELLTNTIYSLNGKDYNKKKIIYSKDYKLVKLSDISEFLSKSKRNASFGQLNGKYNFYTSSNKVQKCDVADYNEESIIIGSGGVANIKIDNIFSCSADNFILKLKNNKYIYYLLKGNMNFLIDGFTGSTLKHISKEYLQNLQLPIPKSEEKIKDWVDKISKPYNKKIKKEQQLKELEIEIQNKIKDITENENCEEVELGSICDIKSGSKSNLQKFIVDNSSCKIIRTRNLLDSTDFLFLNNEGINKCKHNILIKNDILMSSFYDSYICKIIPDDFIGSTYNGGLFKISNVQINIKYFINNINSEYIKNQIYNKSSGSTVLLFNIETLKKVKIKIPKNKDLINNLELYFNKIEELQTEIKENETLYNQFIQDLSNEAIPKNIINEGITEKLQVKKSKN